MTLTILSPALNERYQKQERYFYCSSLLEGLRKSSALPPVTKIITLTMKNAPSIMSNPIIAKKNLLFAEAIFMGSPRDVIHWIPENITITRARKLPKIIKLLTTVWKKAVPEVSSPPRKASGIPAGAGNSSGPAGPPGTLNSANLVTFDILGLGRRRGCWRFLRRFAALGCLGYII